MSGSEHLKVGFQRSAMWDDPLDPSERSCLETILKTWPDGARTVVDIGSGDARVTRHFPPSVEVLKVDRNAEALSRAPGPTLVADIACLPLKDRAFDVALCSNVLEHLTADVLDAAVAEMRRVASDHILIVGPLAEPLEQGMTRCRQCGTRFHPNGHIQSLSVQAIEGLFSPEFELRERAVTEQVWRTVDRFTQAAELSMGVDAFAWPHAVCPACATLQGSVIARPTPAAAAALRLVIEPIPREPRPLESVLWFQRARSRTRRRVEPGILIRSRSGKPESVSLERRPSGLAHADNILTEHPVAVVRAGFLAPDTAAWGGVERCPDGRKRRPLVGPEGLVVLPVGEMLTHREIDVEIFDVFAGSVQISVLDARGKWFDLTPIELKGVGKGLRRRLSIGADWLPPLSSALVKVAAPDWPRHLRPLFGHIGVVARDWVAPPPIKVVASPEAFIPLERYARGRGEYLAALGDADEITVREFDERGRATFWGEAANAYSPPLEPWESAPDPVDGGTTFEAVVLAGALTIIAGSKKVETAESGVLVEGLAAEILEAARTFPERPQALLVGLADLLSGLEADNRGLREKYLQVEARRCDLASENAVFRVQCESLEHRASELEAIVRDDEGKISALSADLIALGESLCARDSEVETLSARLSTSLDDLSIIKAERDKLASRISEVETLSTRLSTSLDDLSITKAERDELASRFSEVHKELDGERRAAREALQLASTAERELFAAMQEKERTRRAANLLEVRLSECAIDSEHREARLSSELQAEHAIRRAMVDTVAQVEATRAAAERAAEIVATRLDDVTMTLERVAAGAAAAAARRDKLAAALSKARASPIGWFVQVPGDSD